MRTYMRTYIRVKTLNAANKSHMKSLGDCLPFVEAFSYCKPARYLCKVLIKAFLWWKLADCAVISSFSDAKL